MMVTKNNGNRPLTRYCHLHADCSEAPVPVLVFCMGPPEQFESATGYCKTWFFRVPFISRISRALQVRENNGPRKFEYSSVSV